METRHVHRTLKDLVAQCQRLQSKRAEIEEIESFLKYSEEMRLWLDKHIKDQFIRDVIVTIPSSNQFIGTQRKVADSIRSIKGVGIGYILQRNAKKREFQKALGVFEKAFTNLEYFVKVQGIENLIKK